MLALIGLVAASVPPLHAQDDPMSRRAAIEAMYPIMMGALEAKSFGRARNICDQAILWEPQNPVHHYNLACIEARAGAARLSHALSALELSIALGFNDVAHMQNDPDLASIRDEPRYHDVIRKLLGQSGVLFNSTSASSRQPVAGAQSQPAHSPSSPVETPASAATAPSGAAAKPASPTFQKGVPVGLYFMTRFWGSTGTLEKAAWYFAPDGTVYQNLEHGFSREDLAAHTGRKGRAEIAGDELTVTWSEGKRSKSRMTRNATGFNWDAGIFTPVAGFGDASEVAGIYEGGESLSGAGARVALSKRLELKADGTFTWNGISFASTTGDTTRVSTSNTGGSAGRWRLDGYSLVLTDANGTALRRIAFPNDDKATPIKPDRMFFGGLLYKRK